MDVNCPRLRFTLQDAKKAVEASKSHSTKYGGNFEWVRRRIYFYKFEHTIPASEAKCTDFPALLEAETNEILPQSMTYVVIDVDVIVVPKKLIEQKLIEHQKQIQQLLQLAHSLEEAKKQLSTLQPASPPFMSEIVTDPDENSISSSVKDQMMKFICQHPDLHLHLTANKALTEGASSIMQITRYAKSRPDIMILRSVMRTDTDEDIPNGLTTENKKELGKSKKGDPVGQTLAGSEKAAGEIVHQYFRDTGKLISSVTVYSLLIDFTRNEAEVYKVSIDFITSESTIYRGTTKLPVSEALNRGLHQLINPSV